MTNLIEAVQAMQAMVQDRQTQRILRMSFPHEDGPAATLLANGLDALEGMSCDFQYNVEVLCDDERLALKDLQGKMVTLELVREDGSTRYFNGWRLTKPTPVERIRLDYRRAFGGIAFATTLDEHGHPEYCAFSGNPAGVGWLPDGADLKPLTKTAREQIEHDIKSIKVLDAPQFEAVDRPVRSPFDRHPTQGLGPIVRWWSPRKERQGTLDEIWRQSRYPEWPYDFDARFYNSAHPDLMSPSLLRGDEAISLGNCVRQGTTLRGSDRILSTRLPGMTVYAQADFGDDQIQLLDFVLDTVGIDLDRQEVTLTWHRLCMPQQTLKRAVIHGMPLDMWDQLKHRAADGARKP